MRAGAIGLDPSTDRPPRTAVVWLVGTIALLPVDLVALPLNMDVVDLWIIPGLPIVWLALARPRDAMSWAYVVPMVVILIGSLASIFAAPEPRNGLIVVLKEVYLYVWLATVTLLLLRFDRTDLRRLLSVWIWAVVVHGAVILAQFASPSLWRVTAEYAGRAHVYDVYRPTGLFVNANSAAFFQLLGFVPLALLFRSRPRAVAVAAFVLCSMAATGSMGATSAFLAAAAVALAVVAAAGYVATSFRAVALALAVALVLGAGLVLVVGQVDRYRSHLEQILVGRADRSADSRFDLWRRGFDVFVDHGAYVWGVGPENFRVVDGEDKQLHNDFLAFLVERGLLGAAGLGLFVTVAVVRAGFLLLVSMRRAGREGVVAVVFLAAIVAAMVESVTHQTFHVREMWLILALQESLLFRMTVLGPRDVRSLPWRSETLAPSPRLG